jgi:hypothetical protein
VKISTSLSSVQAESTLAPSKAALGTIPSVLNIKSPSPLPLIYTGETDDEQLGPRLRVVALIDPNPVQSRKVLDLKRQSFVELAYRDTQEFVTLEDYLDYSKVKTLL